MVSRVPFFDVIWVFPLLSGIGNYGTCVFHVLVFVHVEREKAYNLVAIMFSGWTSFIMTYRLVKDIADVIFYSLFLQLSFLLDSGLFFLFHIRCILVIK